MLEFDHRIMIQIKFCHTAEFRVSQLLIGRPVCMLLHRHMMTSSNGNIFHITGHLCGEFTGEFPAQKPVMRSFDVFFDLRVIYRLSKQSWSWWFETPSCPLWHHCNETTDWIKVKFDGPAWLSLYVLNLSEGTLTYIYILCHSSTLIWHRWLKSFLK